MEIQVLHEWSLSPKEAVVLQKELASQIMVCPFSRPLKHVAGVDISYSKKDNSLFAAVVVMEISTFKIVESASHVALASYPYIPGLLSFREIPPLLKAFERLSVIPDVVLCDGQGIAHPRRMGLAAHLGLWLGIPTIGCAKTRLIGEYKEPTVEKNAQSELFYKSQIVGAVLRSKTAVKPLFISPGHLMDIATSLQIVKKCLGRYRLPEPTRQAHLMVNCLRLNNPLSF